MEGVKELTESPKPLAHVIAMLEDGALNYDGGKKVRDLIATLRDHVADGSRSASGKVTIELDLRLESGVMEIRADVKTKEPKKKRDKSTYWLTDGNNLSADNPKQLPLGARPRVVTDEQPVRKLS